MHHGTCSDFNQFCPNARLPTSRFATNLRNHRRQFYYTQLRQQLLKEQPTTEAGEEKREQEGENNYCRQHTVYCGGSTRNSRPRSQQSLHVPQPTTTTNSTAYHQPILVVPAECPTKLIDYHRLPPRSLHHHHNKTRRGPCLGSASTGSSNGDAFADHYQQHICQFFYHDHQFNSETAATFLPVLFPVE